MVNRRVEGILRKIVQAPRKRIADLEPTNGECTWVLEKLCI